MDAEGVGGVGSMWVNRDSDGDGGGIAVLRDKEIKGREID